MFSNEKISKFNDLECLLYKYISQNTDKVIYMSIRELANETHVSTSTIIRFCKKLNCDGFSEFKVKLKIHKQASSKQNTFSINAHHSLHEFMELTSNCNFENSIKRFSKNIANCNNVLFFGIGSSRILAEYGARLFLNMGIPALHLNDPFLPIQPYISENSNSIIIVLSVSGETPVVLEQIHRFKVYDLTIGSITNNHNSSLAKLSDINISYYVSEETYHGTNVTTQIPVLYLLEALAQETYKIKFPT